MRLFRLFATAKRSLPRILPLARDARVPFWLKFAAAAAAVLIVSPLDVFGDIPVVGLFDDAALLALLVNLFVTLAERATVQQVSYVKPARVVRTALEG